MENNNPFNQNSHFNKPAQVLKPMGTFLKTDENGYLIPEVSLSKVQEKLLPVVASGIVIGKELFGEDLHSVYLRGSVAKGAFIDGISDFDFKFVTKEKTTKELENKLTDALAELAKKYPEITKIDKGISFVEEFTKGKNPINKYQTLCVYGEDLSKDLPPLKPGKETRGASKSILRTMSEMLVALETENNPSVLQRNSVKICKQIIRSAHDLVGEKLQRYTRDVYPAYEGAIQVYPEQKALLHRIAEIAVFGSTNKQELISLIEQSKAFLEPELTTVFGAK